VARKARKARHAEVLRAMPMPNCDVPPYAAAVPDAVISRLAELPPLVASW
jgi:hypothetical protein